MSLSSELYRRNVFKVGAAYLVVAWLLLEVASVVSPILDLPTWVPRAILLLLVIGFPLSLIFAWAFEVTPEGIKPTSDVKPEDSITGLTGRKLDFVVIGLLSIAVLVLAVDKYVLVEEPDKSATISEPSIAVLPFADMSPDKDQEYLSDGISEELLNLLAQVEGLKVIARTSSFAFKDQNIGIKEIAEELDVAHILEGSVRKAEDRLRITAQLILAEDGRHLWSDTWERDHKDVFAIQDEIAAAVVERMHIELMGEPLTSPTADVEAHELYLRGRKQFERLTTEGWTQAESLFLESIDLDAEYAPVWRSLAATYGFLGIWRARPVEEVYPLAKAAVEKAQELDPENNADYATLAWFAVSFENDVEAAASYIAKAQDLMTAASNSGMTLEFTANVAILLGRFEEALQVRELQIQFDGRNPVAHLGKAFALLNLGRCDDAIAKFRLVDEMSPGFVDASAWIAECLLEQGRVTAALAELSPDSGELSSRLKANPWRLSVLTRIYHELGRDADADAALSKLMSEYEAFPVLIAYALDARGEMDQAFAQLEKARERGDHDFLYFLAEPRSLNMRDDPRWLPLLRSVGMAPKQLAEIELNTDTSTFTRFSVPTSPRPST